jgi:hypothetical protein
MALQRYTCDFFDNDWTVAHLSCHLIGVQLDAIRSLYALDLAAPTASCFARKPVLACGTQLLMPCVTVAARALPAYCIDVAWQPMLITSLLGESLVYQLEGPGSRVHSRPANCPQSELPARRCSQSRSAQVSSAPGLGIEAMEHGVDLARWTCGNAKEGPRLCVAGQQTDRFVRARTRFRQQTRRLQVSSCCQHGQRCNAKASHRQSQPRRSAGSRSKFGAFQDW